MRFKLVPDPPADLNAVRHAQRAVPLVPGDEDDCCARLARRCGFPSRDVARTWLTFLRALGLVEETPSGFKRTDVEPTPDHLRSAVLDRVLLASEVLSALVAAADAGEGPLDTDAVFGRVRDRVPRYEHHKNPETWETIWRDRVATLLAWLALLDLAASVDGAVGDADATYRPTDRGAAVVT